MGRRINSRAWRAGDATSFLPFCIRVQSTEVKRAMENTDGADQEQLDEEPKSIILSMIKQLKYGMDLHRVTFPTFVLEPRSMLERITDFMSHQDLLLACVTAVATACSTAAGPLIAPMSLLIVGSLRSRMPCSAFLASCGTTCRVGTCGQRYACRLAAAERAPCSPVCARACASRTTRCLARSSGAATSWTTGQRASTWQSRCRTTRRSRPTFSPTRSTGS